MPFPDVEKTGKEVGSEKINGQKSRDFFQRVTFERSYQVATQTTES